METANGLLVIGWREHVSLPLWRIEDILAKADTGARSSAIDVKNLEELPGDRVRFGVALSRQNRDKLVHVEETIVRRTRVRSSTGHVRERLFVETTLKVGPVETTVELGLVCRKKMICRMLLGRSAMAGHFLVDSATKHHFGGRLKKQRERRKHRKSGRDAS